MAGGRMSDPRKGGTFKVKAPTPAASPDERYRYRSRATAPGPFGDVDEPYEGTLADVLDRHADDDEAGLEPIVEYKVPGVTWSPWRRPLLLSELALEGLAHERTHMVKTAPGEFREVTRWELEPGAWERLREAERS